MLMTLMMSGGASGARTTALVLHLGQQTQCSKLHTTCRSSCSFHVASYNMQVFGIIGLLHVGMPHSKAEPAEEPPAEEAEEEDSDVKECAIRVD